MPSCSLLAALRQVVWSPAALCASEASAILVCGGDPAREEFAARMASTGALASAQLYVSSGMYRRVTDFDPDDMDNPHRQRMHGVDFAALKPRLHLDRRAVDTVGNLTTLARDLADGGHTNVALVTSAEHMRRAAVCAAIVLGSYRISFTPVSCETAANGTESWLRTARDACRCVLWVLTGCDGETIARWMHPHRH